MCLLASTDASVGFSDDVLDTPKILGVYGKCGLPSNGCFGVLCRAETVCTDSSLDYVDLNRVDGFKHAHQSQEVFIR